MLSASGIVLRVMCASCSLQTVALTAMSLAPEVTGQLLHSKSLTEKGESGQRFLCENQRNLCSPFAFHTALHNDRCFSGCMSEFLTQLLPV